MKTQKRLAILVFFCTLLAGTWGSAFQDDNKSFNQFEGEVVDANNGKALGICNTNARWNKYQYYNQHRRKLYFEGTD